MKLLIFIWLDLYLRIRFLFPLSLIFSLHSCLITSLSNITFSLLCRRPKLQLRHRIVSSTGSGERTGRSVRTSAEQIENHRYPRPAKANLPEHSREGGVANSLTHVKSMNKVGAASSCWPLVLLVLPLI